MANSNKADESVTEATPRETNPARNAWLIRLGDKAHNRRFSVTVDHGSLLFWGVEKGDGVLIAGGDPLAVASFARIYRIRGKLDETTFFFDGVLPVNGEESLPDLGVTVAGSKAAIVRLEWPVFKAALKAAAPSPSMLCPYWKAVPPRNRLCAETVPAGRHRQPDRYGGWLGHGSAMTRTQTSPMSKMIVVPIRCHSSHGDSIYD